MPKPMMMFVEVEEIAFGRVFRTLNTMEGVSRITINADKEAGKAARPYQNGGRAPKGKGLNTSVCLMLGALMEGPKQREELAAVLVAGGKSEKTTHGQTFKMREEGLCRTNGKGKYTITAAGKRHYENACLISEAE